VRHSYRTYGLTVQSDIPVTGLVPLAKDDGLPDLRLDLGDMPEWAALALSLTVTAVQARPESFMPGEGSFTVSEFSSGQFFLLSYADGSRCLVDHRATQLWGEPGPGLSHDDLCVYVLGPVMGFVLRLRGRTPLHASAVAADGRTIALVGNAGAGKSTTAAALALRGWAVLAEDVCALEDLTDQYHVLPGYPRICLWPDSVSILFSSPEALPLVVPGWEKRFLPLDGSLAHFASQSSPLAAIFLLGERSTLESAPTIEPLSKKDALLQLVQNTYMNWLLDKRQRAEEFDILAKLVTGVECFKLIPSADPKRLPALTDLIESQALQLPPLSPYPALNTASGNV
jgi:hypothetical protein